MLNFPKFALSCIEILEKNGHEAFFVGGCVRDGLLGQPCDDVDVTTSATPEEVIEIFEKTIPTGLKHGTVTVILDEKNIEVTTYRTEDGYKDSRHPDNVKFVSDIKFDLSRRDFTINAMAYNPKTGLIDLFGGISDLQNKIIRTVGHAKQRFEEDALRILRAYRFSCKLGFAIDPITESSAIALTQNLAHISGERVFSELTKIADSLFPDNSVRLFNSGALAHFGLLKARHNSADFRKLSSLELDAHSKVILLVHFCEHNLLELKEKLHPDNNFLETLRRVDAIEKDHPDASKPELKKIMRDYGIDALKLYLNGISVTDPTKADACFKTIKEINDLNEPYLISHLEIGGKEIMSLGYSGETVGVVLNQILSNVIEHPENNRKELLYELIPKIMSF